MRGFFSRPAALAAKMEYKSAPLVALVLGFPLAANVACWALIMKFDGAYQLGSPFPRR